LLAETTLNVSESIVKQVAAGNDPSFEQTVSDAIRLVLF
jgi:hypothetical protein